MDETVDFQMTDKYQKAYEIGHGNGLFTNHPEDEDPPRSAAAFDAIQEVARNKLGCQLSVHTDERERKGVQQYWGGHPIDVSTVASLSVPASVAFVAFLKYASPLIQEWLKNKGSRSVLIRSDGKEVLLTGNVSHKDIQNALITLALASEPRRKPRRRRAP